jgi:hypothetical protein
MVAPMQLAAPSAWAWARAGRVWLATLGRAGLGRAMPAWLGAAIVGGAIFGGNGLAPRDVAALAAGAPRVIAVVACGWLVLLTPAARAIVGAPGCELLRTLPGAPPLEALARLACGLAIHAPWAAVAVAARGAIGALTWLGLALASLAIALAMARWTRTPRRPRWRGPVAALLGVHGRAIARRRGGSLLFALGLAVLGGALAAAMVESAAVAALPAAALVAAVAAVAVACGLVAVGTAVVEDDLRLRAWVAAAATPRGAIAGARAAVLVLAGALLGAVVAAATIAIATPPAAHVAAIATVALVIGGGIGLAMTAVARKAIAAPHPGQTLAGGAGGVALAAVIAIGVLSLLGVAAVVVVGGALAVGGRAR